MLPHPYQSEDSSRMALAYFALSSLCLLGALDRLDDAERSGYVEWVYARQKNEGGFAGGCDVDESGSSRASKPLDTPHLVHTYTALLILGMLARPDSPAPLVANPFSLLRRDDLVRFVERCQRYDGSFAPFPASTEHDVRFVYCAMAIYKMLGVASTTAASSVSSAMSFLRSCRRYDGGYGQSPHLEPQGGSTYCVIAAMALVEQLGKSLGQDELEETTRWLVERQTEYEPEPDSDEEDEEGRGSAEAQLHDGPIAGFQGRPGKPPDACYSFWCTAALAILSESPAIRRVNPRTAGPFHDSVADRRYLLECQSRQWGGIARSPGDHPDIYHTYLALAALALGKETPELAPLNAKLNAEEGVSRLIHKMLASNASRPSA